VKTLELLAPGRTWQTLDQLPIKPQGLRLSPEGSQPVGAEGMALAETIASKLIPDGDANRCWYSLNAAAPDSLQMVDKIHSCNNLNYYETRSYTIYLIFFIDR
jgi:hypothetical protein